MSFYMRILMLVCAGLMLAFPGCRGKGAARGPYREFAFNVDSALLGNQTSVDGITFFVPRGWGTADSTVLARVRQIASEDTTEFAVYPQSVYIGLDFGGILIATTYKTKPGATEGFTGWTRRYLSAYRTAHPNIKLQEEWLLLNNLHAVQLMAMDSLRVQFKFLIESDPVVSLDFSVPRTAWEKEVHAVESSLGTIRKR